MNLKGVLVVLIVCSVRLISYLLITLFGCRVMLLPCSKYPLEIYEKIYREKGFNDPRAFERWLILHRFGYAINDKIIYEVARKIADRVRDAELSTIIDNYKDRYFDHIDKGYSFYINYNDREKLVRKIALLIEDNEFTELISAKPPSYDLADLGTFRGLCYTYELGGTLKNECSWDAVYRDTKNALRDTKGRVFYFLKAIIEIYRKEGAPEPTYFNAPSLSKIQEKIAQITGHVKMLTPVDYVTLKAYRIYFKAGSRRYPTHAIPIESIPPIEKALNEWREQA